MKKSKEHFIEIEGNSVEEAIEMGIRQLNLPREKIKIKILSEPHAGLFGMNGPSRAKIRIFY